MSQTVATNRRLLLVAMTLANAMILIDQTAVPLTLPNIAADLNVDAGAVQWVLNASLLPLAGLLVLGGRLGDLLGRRRIFLLGSALFGGASAVAGLAPTFQVLLAARVVQGVGGALMLPATVAILSDAYPRADPWPRLGIDGRSCRCGRRSGPTIGGLLTSVFSWRAVLLVNLPLLLLTLLFTLRSVPPVDPRRTGHVHTSTSSAPCCCASPWLALVFGLSETTVWVDLARVLRHWLSAWPPPSFSCGRSGARTIR